MHHVALNGPRPHDGDLNDQIVKYARAQLGQHRHLRPAFHLKHAKAIAFAKHVIGRHVILGHCRQLFGVAVMPLHQRETFADAGQHPQRQHIHLEDTKRVDIVLVPLDERPLRHGAIANRHDLGQGPFGQDEAADMLGQMARHAGHLIGELENHAQIGVIQADPRLRRAFILHLRLKTAPDGFGKCRGDILAQPHRLADLANGRARAVMDHSRTQPRPVAAVFVIHILDDLFAPFMFEIHVDIGRLVTLLAQETLKQHRGLVGVNTGHAQAKAHGRVRRRAAPLAQNGRLRLMARKTHNVVDRQKILRDVLLGDQCKLLLDGAAYMGGHALWVAPPRPFPGQPLQLRHGCAILGRRLMGVLVFQIRQRKIAGIRHLPRGADRMRPLGKQAYHLSGRFQVPLGIGLQQKACLGNCRLLADAGHHILQGPPVRRVVEHIIGRQNTDPMRAGQSVQPVDPRPVIAGIKIGRRDMFQPRQRAFQPWEVSLETVEIGRRHGDKLQAICLRHQHLQCQVGLPLQLPRAVMRRHFPL